MFNLAAVFSMERLKTEFNALNKEIGQKRKVKPAILEVDIQGYVPVWKTSAA
jgi:hypothetical protein